MRAGATKRLGGRTALLSAMVATAALAGCGLPLTRETRYTGMMTPEMTCGQPSRATLTTVRGHFTFAPDDGVVLLSGDVGGDGAVSATLTTPGADRKGFVMRFEGRLDKTHVTGRYLTPRCGFTVALDAVG